MKRYLKLLVLCAILSQEIETKSKDNNKSSDLLIRKKRIINKTPQGNTSVKINQVPYIVNIRKNGNRKCGGSILSPEIILTAAHCFDKLGQYTILSGSSYGDKGTRHNIIKIVVHPHYNKSAFANDLALLTIFPPIDLINSSNRKITLFNGNVPPESLGTVSGWGYMAKIGNAMLVPYELRSINVPIINNKQCRQYYYPEVEITDKDICTLDKSGTMLCATGDSGGPLVVHNQMVGVFAWSGERYKKYNPDVFMRLSHPEYKNWIISNTPYNPYNRRDSLQEIFEEIHNRLWFGVPRRKTFQPKYIKSPRLFKIL